MCACALRVCARGSLGLTGLSAVAGSQRSIENKVGVTVGAARRLRQCAAAVCAEQLALGALYRLASGREPKFGNEFLVEPKRLW